MHRLYTNYTHTMYIEKITLCDLYVLHNLRVKSSRLYFNVTDASFCED